MTSGKAARVTLTVARFHIPPVESVLVVGTRAPIGARAMEKAFEEMMPNTFLRIEVGGPTVEALIVRRSHLKRIPEEKLIGLVLRHAEDLMEDSEMLQVGLNIEVVANEEILL
jgi:hypothetical protein